MPADGPKNGNGPDEHAAEHHRREGRELVSRIPAEQRPASLTTREARASERRGRWSARAGLLRQAAGSWMAEGDYHREMAAAMDARGQAMVREAAALEAQANLMTEEATERIRGAVRVPWVRLTADDAKNDLWGMQYRADRLAMQRVWDAQTRELQDRYPAADYPEVNDRLAGSPTVDQVELDPDDGLYFLALIDSVVPGLKLDDLPGAIKHPNGAVVPGGVGIRRIDRPDLEAKGERPVEVWKLWTAGDLRGLDIGKRLVTAAEAYATHILGGTVVLSQTGVNQPESIKLHGTLGYQPIPRSTSTPATRRWRAPSRSGWPRHGTCGERVRGASIRTSRSSRHQPDCDSMASPIR
jgi:GNAT superfamily N-acetyltransferase